MLAGVAAGVVLPRLNKEPGAVACGAAPPAGCADVLWFASLDASLLPKPPKGLPAGCAGVELGVALPNRLGVEDAGAGFAPPPLKRFEAFPAPEPA